MTTWRLSLVGAVALTLIAAAQVRGDWIAYQGKIGTGPRTIVIMTEYGTRPVPLPMPPGTQGDLMTPSLAPDGKAVAFAARVGPVYKIFTWVLDDFAATVGSPKQLTSGDSHDEQPVWSPDGKKIAYLSMKGNEFGLFVIDAQGGQPAKVAELTRRFRLASPTWSPDSRRIAYCRDGELWVAAVGQGEPVRLAQEGWYPAWSPDGGRFAAFVRLPKGELVLLTDQGKAEKTLVSGVVAFGQIAWSPDGKRILFKAGSVGGVRGALWVVDAQGGKPEPLRSHGDVHGYVSWSRSPVVHIAAAAPSPAATRAAVQRPVVRPTLPLAARTPRRPPTTLARPALQKRAAAPPGKTIQVVPSLATPPAPAAEEAVKIVSPVDGSGVRQVIRVAVSKKAPEGYIVFQVDKAFQYATASPFEWKWDTRTVWSGEADVSTADKDYTIAAIAYSATGEREGQAQVTVKVQNGIQPDALGPSGMLLRLRFLPDQVQRKKIDADSRFEGPDTPQWAKQQLEGRLEGTMEQEVESVTRDGSTAALVTRLKEDTRLAIGGVAAPMPEIQRSARTTEMSSGTITTSQAAAGQHRITLGEIYTKMPQQPVSVKDSWTSPMTFIVDLTSRQLYEVAGQHRVEELKWMQDAEALRIRSYGSLSSVVMLPQNVSLRAVTITRDTWFAYKERRILRIEDTIQGEAEIPVTTTATSAVPAPRGPAAPPAAPDMTISEHEEIGFSPDQFEPYRKLTLQSLSSTGERLWEEKFQERRGIFRPRQPGLPSAPGRSAPPTAPGGTTPAPRQYKRAAYILTLAVYDVK